MPRPPRMGALGVHSLTNVTVIHRGDVLTPGGLSHIDTFDAAAASQQAVAERQALSNPRLGCRDLPQAQIDQVTAALRADPEQGPLLAGPVGEASGEGLAISSIRLRELGDPDGLDAVELELADIVASIEGLLEVRRLSSATIDEESAEFDARPLLLRQ